MTLEVLLHERSEGVEAIHSELFERGEESSAEEDLRQSDLIFIFIFDDCRENASAERLDVGSPLTRVDELIVSVAT